jgi:signal transduction histidine kinase/pSer/pThr/pTyr-binding forkhead associated (FHA) protein
MPFPPDNQSQPIRLEPGVTSIGRASSNTIQLNHDSVSRTHAEISCQIGQYILTDLDSHNGTFINKKRINKSVLSHSDIIFIGNYGFTFLTQSVESQEACPDLSFASGDTVSISEEEIELSELLAHSANDAAHKFLEPSPDDKKLEEQSFLAHKRLSLLYLFSEKLRSAKDLDEILSRGFELVFKALPAAGRAVAMLQSEVTGSFEVRAVKFLDQKPNEEAIPVSRTILDLVIKERMAIISPNVLDDSRFDQSESIASDNIRSIICVPLFDRDKVIGALHVDSRDVLNSFTQNDMEFAAAVSNEMALAIENCRLQHEAIKNEKMVAIGLTITNLAHNIKNMLSLNKNAVDLMDDHLETIKDSNLQKNWRLVHQSLETIANLTADMLEYTQIDSVDLRPIDINSIILDNCELVKVDLAKQGIVLELDLDRNLSNWKMSETLLQRALFNLVINAKDAVKVNKYGRIKISTTVEDGQRLIISVSDNGCGMEQDKLNNIFELFFTTKGMDGSGLGLPMVQRFVESLGGTIAVESRAGAGSTFRMVFPKIDNE